MARALHARRALLGRDVLVAYATLVALYLLGYVRFPPFQITRYLLVVTYDLVEVVLPVLSPLHPVGFPLFLYLLATGGAAVARRRQGGGSQEPDWLRAAGGACLVVASLSFGFAAMAGGPLVAARDNPTPLLVTGRTGLVFLAAGWWLLTREP